MVYCVTTLMIAAGRSERLTAEAEVHRLATRDSLTKLPNRHLFDTHIERTIGSARRQKKKAAVIFIDLDHFKKVISRTPGRGRSIEIKVSKELLPELDPVPEQ